MMESSSLHFSGMQLSSTTWSMILSRCGFRVVLPHIESKGNDFRDKGRMLCLMASRVLDGAKDPELIDDKDYYGNKRLELAGQLLSLMFEDLFKRFCAQVRWIYSFSFDRCSIPIPSSHSHSVVP